MDKFKKATKRIVAVGASALMVSSAAFGNLGNYPNNFADTGVDVVVGASAAAIDTTSANAVIEDLKAEFAGGTKYEVTATMSNGGKKVSAVDEKETLNYNETLESVNADLDKDTTSLLEDGSLDNTDYTQEITLLNGKFDYRIFDEVDDETVAKAGLYYDANAKFAEYVMELEAEVDVTTGAGNNAEDLVGDEITIMGNEFTIVSISDSKLTLIGGSNKISLGEGESTSVTVDGKVYEISVQSVATAKVLVTVNGQTKSIDEYDTEKLAGVSIAVTDLVSSSRDSVKGYAEIVVGGQKVELTESGVKINDEDFEDVYEDYQIDVDFTSAVANKFTGMTITYRVDENVVLGEGDSLDDVLFDTFSIVYEGTNDVDYSTYTISTSNDRVSFSGNLFNGKAIPSEFKLTTDNVAGEDLYLGSNNKRVYFSGSDLNIADLITANSLDAITYDNTTNQVSFELDNATTDVKDNIFFSRIKDDEFYFYKITKVNKDDFEIDVKDILTDKSNLAIDLDDVQATLELNANVATNTTDSVVLDLDNLGAAELYLENELTLDFSAVEVVAFTAGGTTSDLVFKYNADIDMDDTGYDGNSFTISLGRATDEDDAIEMTITDDDFVNNGGSGDDVEEDSDFEVFVDHYGTRVTIDTDKKDDVKIEVPDKEVEAVVSVVFGSVSTETKEMTFDSEDEANDWAAEMEADGYKTTVKEVTSTAVDVEVGGVLTDDEVSGTSNMVVVGGPAVNAVARELLGIGTYTIDQAGVAMGEGVIKYYADSNSVLVYGYSGDDTAAAVAELNGGGLSGTSVKVN